MTELGPQISTAIQFINDADLPPLSGAMRSSGGLAKLIEPQSRKQSLAVGHGVLSFLPSLPSKHRETVANCFLLAQLVADKKAEPAEMDAWYTAFFDAIRNLGWIVQEHRFGEHDAVGTGVETHNAILDVAATLLGSTSAAFDLVRATLEGLKQLSQEDWLVLFRQESDARRETLFQMAVADAAEGDDVSISLMAFQFSARTDQTKVVFLQWETTEAQMRQTTGKVFFSNTVAEGMRDELADKVRSYVGDYIAQLEI